MTENQKLWLEEIIKEHLADATNIRLWAKGCGNPEWVGVYEESAEEHIEFADMLKTLLED